MPRKGTKTGPPDQAEEKVQDIPLYELHPFKNHPFKVLDDEAMQQTVDSILQYGVMVPAIARPSPEGGYELIAGHRRLRASELAGKETMPVIVREMDDDAATIFMVDSNLQREELLPSERAFAYRMKNEAMKRQAGRPGKGNVGQLVPNSFGRRTTELIGEVSGESYKQVQRFIRLTYLIPELLDMVDQRKVAFNPAVELSYLTEDEQRDFLEAMDYAQATPSLSQAQRIKKYSQEGKCSLDVMCAVMDEVKKDDMSKVTISHDVLRKYFPKSYTPKQMEDTIIRLLEQWQKRRQREQAR